MVKIQKKKKDIQIEEREEGWQGIRIKGYVLEFLIKIKDIF